MRRNVILGCLVLLCTLVFVVPAQAVVVNGVDYRLYGRCKIGLEQGGTTIDGNVRVAQICGSANGFLQIGADTIITGVASANRMSFATGAQVNGGPPACLFNINAGGNPAVVCNGGSAGVPGFVPDASWFPLPVPTVVAGATDVTCVGALGAGPFRDITVPDGAVCNISGVVAARNVLVGNLATLDGGVGATLNVRSTFKTEPGAIINNTNVTSVLGVATPSPTPSCTGANGLGVQADGIFTGVGAAVTGSILYAPCARMHLKLDGTFSNGFEAIAVLITVQPVDIKDGFAPCACVGFVEKGGGNTILLSQGCHLDGPNLNFFVVPAAVGCPTDPNVIPCPSCTAVTRLAGATDTNASLSFDPAIPPGVYRVVVMSEGRGFFCTSGTVSLP